MKKIAFVIFGFLLGTGVTVAQQNIKEEIYLHLSSTDLIVGENLNFSSFTYSQLTGRVSGLSSLIYIELVDAKGNSVFQGKFPQKEGRSSGDIFLNTDLETGNYRVVAYTRWMKNFDQRYEKVISIVNPYKTYANAENEEESEYDLKYYFEGGSFAAGLENQLVLTLLDQWGKPAKLKARLLKKGGEKIADLIFNDKGIATVSFMTDQQSNYQVALELPSSFKFIDLPAPCKNCTKLSLVDRGENLLLKVESNNVNSDKIGVLEIWSPAEMVQRFNSTMQSQHILTKKELPEGKLIARLYIDNMISNERVFWNGRLNNLKQIKPLVYGVDSYVQKKVDVPSEGVYSVSVKKIYGYESINQLEVIALFPNSMNQERAIYKEELNDQLLDQMMIMSNWEFDSELVDSVKFMPEYKSGIVQGKVTSNKGDFEDVNVALSFQGSQMELDAYKVDKKGQFILKYDPLFANEKGVVKVLNDEDQEYQVEIFDEYYKNYKPMTGPSLSIDSVRLAKITQRAIANQIQNAYFEVEEYQDSTRAISTFGSMKSYVLDDYTRFKTMRDTFIELVYEVGVSKNESKFNLNMRTVDLSYNDKADVETMVLLDGAFSTSEDVLKLSPYLVERIDVLDRRYFMGDVMFDGIISIHTFEGDGGDTEPFGHQVDLSELQRTSEVTSTELEERAPKFNDLLYWNPSINTESDELNIEFKTSMVEGEYEIRIEGITSTGNPYSHRSTFIVEKQLP
ncbi:hypothetical protein [Reichenbachiella ulvae]|uniref:MG2 domain-containing protein n=1 Tax=Reichenbachiella ulvae TaxID=2980104 RepID=A0ABT3CNJ7_9BACT|nr:hypothetical protein [Reichenbachiella ulvae]MCV9385044.1 hypothetical protein [Reichenbachiella ulvae]